MKFELWYLLLGGLMLVVALVDQFVKQLPITTTIVYLAVGVVLGPLGYGVLHLNPLDHAWFFERFTELAVIVSLFTSGLKLRAPLWDKRWRLPWRLAFISMAITVGLIALVGVFLLHLSWGAAILLGAILSPTDPVLASDVQVEHPGQRDRLRFSLTGEAGLNDGTAFPFVLLGLGLLGLHDIGSKGWRWVTVDLVWAVVAGLGVGALLGTLVGKCVVYLRKRREETLGRDEFIALGLIGFSYGLALQLQSYGFLAVFAAGVALRHYELRSSKDPGEAVQIMPPLSSPDDPAVREQEKTPAYMAKAVLVANEQLERILEIGLVLMVGGMLTERSFNLEVLWLAPVLFLLIRPLAVWIGTWGSEANPLQKTLLSWFGIRGIGSLYYLMYAIEKGLPRGLASHLADLVLAMV